VLSFNPAADADSLRLAFERAIAFDRASIDRSQVLNWDQVTEEIFMPARSIAPGPVIQASGG
jgi:hypothetical protein